MSKGDSPLWQSIGVYDQTKIIISKPSKHKETANNDYGKTLKTSQEDFFSKHHQISNIRHSGQAAQYFEDNELMIIGLAQNNASFSKEESMLQMKISFQSEVSRSVMKQDLITVLKQMQEIQKSLVNESMNILAAQKQTSFDKKIKELSKVHNQQSQGQQEHQNHNFSCFFQLQVNHNKQQNKPENQIVAIVRQEQPQIRPKQIQKQLKTEEPQIKLGFQSIHKARIQKIYQQIKQMQLNIRSLKIDLYNLNEQHKNDVKIRVALLIKQFNLYFKRIQSKYQAKINQYKQQLTKNRQQQPLNIQQLTRMNQIRNKQLQFQVNKLKNQLQNAQRTKINQQFKIRQLELSIRQHRSQFENKSNSKLNQQTKFKQLQLQLRQYRGQLEQMKLAKSNYQLKIRQLNLQLRESKRQQEKLDKQNDQLKFELNQSKSTLNNMHSFLPFNIEKPHSTNQRSLLETAEYSVQLLIKKNKQIEQQIVEKNIEHQTAKIKIKQLRDNIEQRDIVINSKQEEIRSKDIKIRQLQLTIEDNLNHQKQSAKELRVQKQQLDKQKVGIQQQLVHQKRDQQKLKTLLKASQEQLTQCQIYMKNVGQQLARNQKEKQQLTQLLNKKEIQHFKQLQQYDQQLINLQSDLYQTSLNFTKKEKDLQDRQIILQSLRDQIRQKQLEVQNRQYQSNMLRNIYQQKILNLQRKQEGMKVEYQAAIDAQNATRDRCYKQYQNIFSKNTVKKQHFFEGQYQIYSQKMNENLRCNINRKIKSPLKNNFKQEYSQPQCGINNNLLYKYNLNQRGKINQILNKNKSETNNIKKCLSSRDMLVNQKKREQVPEPLVGLSSRINYLKSALSKQLGNIREPKFF